MRARAITARHTRQRGVHTAAMAALGLLAISALAAKPSILLMFPDELRALHAALLPPARGLRSSSAAT
jgi:hypothetical protein